MIIRLTIFRDLAATAATPAHGTFEAIAALIRRTVKPTKGALPLLSLAQFGEARSPTGSLSLRHDANVTAITGAVIDYDGEEVAFATAVEMLRAANVAALVYTTASHRPEAPRWRIIAPASTALPPGEHLALVSRVNGIIDGIAHPESWTLSQAFYFGQVEGAPPVQIAIVEGEPINRLPELDAGAIGKPGSSPRASQHSSARPTVPDGEPEAPIEDIIAALDTIPNNGRDWHEFNRIGMAVWRASGGSQGGLDAFMRWSAKYPAYDLAETRARWTHYVGSPPSMTGFGMLVKEARKTRRGWRAPSTHHRLPSPQAERVRDWPEPTTIKEEVTEARGRLPQTVARYCREENYAMGGVDRTMNEVMRARPGQRRHALNGSAYALGRMVINGWISGGMVVFSLGYGAECCGFVRDHGEAEAVAVIRHGMLDGLLNPHPPLGPWAGPRR